MNLELRLWRSPEPLVTGAFVQKKGGGDDAPTDP